jgi:hypothetical protein
MTKRHVQHLNGVWTYEVTLESTPPAPRPVPEATVIPVVSPHAMEQWLMILAADWARVTS